MRVVLTLWLICAGWAAAAATSETAERLAAALHLREAAQILSEEGVQQVGDIDAAMLEGRGGSYLRAQIEDLYDPAWMHDRLIEALAAGMTATEMTQAAVFFEGETGRTVIRLENSARRAFSDESIRQAALDALAEADQEAEFFRLIDEFVQVNNLVDQNVAGTLGADYAFLRGLADGQGVAADSDQMLAQLLEQAGETEDDTREWLYSFLMLAYGPLDPAQLRENIAFSRTEAGRALNRALFAGLGDMYEDLSYQVGFAVGQVLSASDL
ncbi:hypothetical protein SAMN05444279_13327 [Ruegeria intermedia]|uniref:DUF2059 domain-containing protein n=1 Tax=Ruegeria intermedia TaxID=996115 RepID=A0A1M5B6Z5_9RHOB|nr:DUF2059 domain-containing protein [Ruegeria intermedia]SHF38225.1 hypothetical protein SAMN05444279_13327 [Ruegeria intermedia]